ncbi:hypothetical protein GCM10020369_07610 [Cryptosporangium minutisporangium]|uniref:Acetyl-coenzyme A carboxylase carboxyl transferase subunit alpha n=1 Tax=Cryptosporangium minutisporangium TaxID=113569 RepID=A0ABP6SRH9_9ACTN
MDDRVEQLLDPGSWRPAERQPVGGDPLGFVDSRPYPQRLDDARRRSGRPDAVCYGFGQVDGHDVVLAVMDFSFLGGSMGSAVGEAIVRAAEDARSSRTPLVLVVASGGARMQEGALSLMQMAKTAQAMRRLHEDGVLSVAILTDPTFGGVTASFATLADVLIGEQGAHIGFAGPRVIANATRERLPEGFQTAEYLLGAGLLDRVESRRELRSLLGRVLDLAGGRPTACLGHPDVVVGDPAAVDTGESAAETLQLARDVRRPTTLDYVGRICDDWLELHGDRLGDDDPAIVGGLASIAGHRIVLLGHQKGHDTAERVARNFGMAGPAGYRKALRLMRLAERLGLPVVTLVDTQGAAPGIDAERYGQSWAIAECIAGMARLETPVLSVVIGEGGSGGALALATANQVFALSNACYSVISPESCSTILYGDPSHGPRMAEALRLTAPEQLRLGIVDGVVPEPDGGTQSDPATAAARLKDAILGGLARMAPLSAAQLRDQRHNRFRALGVVDD